MRQYHNKEIKRFAQNPVGQPNVFKATRFKHYHAETRQRLAARTSSLFGLLCAHVPRRQLRKREADLSGV